MRRLLWLALAAGAACSQVSKVDPAPTDVFYRPGGLGVYAGNLIVASTNSDLLYDTATGGSVITVNPAAVPAGGDPQYPQLVGGLRIESFAGEMAIADDADRPGRDERCGGLAPLALVPARGADVLYRIALGTNAAPSCNGCSVPLSGGGHYADAYTVTVACAAATATAPAMARAYVGYLRGEGGSAWVSELDLLDPSAPPRSNSFGNGQMLGFAFDASRRRLYAAQAGLGLRWIDVVGDCRLDVDDVDGGCRSGFAALPTGMDAHALVLSRADPLLPGPRRLYILARVVDTRAASSSGVAAYDVDGVLLVTELVEDLYGGMTLQLVEPPISVGYGPVALAILPGRTGTGKRDVVAALASDDSVLVLYDDDSGAEVVIGKDDRGTATHAATGHPWLGRQPFGLAVDPATTADGSAVVYVGSWSESYVTRLVVPMADIRTMQLPPEFTLTQIKGGR